MAESTFQAGTLNHVTITVADLEESRSFYNRLLGLPLWQQGKTTYNLGPLGSSFISLTEQNPRGIISSFCFGVEGGQTQLIQDPDGVRVRIEAVTYAGSEPPPTSQPAARSPIFSAKRLTNIEINAGDLSRSADFYQRTFGLSVIKKEESIVVLSVGKEQSITLSTEQGRKKGSIDHITFGIETFAPDTAVGRLALYLPEVNPSDVTDQFISILDPNGIKLQVAGLDYRG